jgi:mannose-6-phosphate isomerase-like protein (cupin superfamily)
VKPVDLATIAAAAKLNARGTTIARVDRLDIAVSRFSKHPRWEFHPEGDELLIGISGELQITLLLDDGPETSVVRPGEVVVVPRGVWHSPVPLGEVSLLSMAEYAGTRVSNEDDPRV